MNEHKEEIYAQVTKVIVETLGIDASKIKPEITIEELCTDSIQIFSLIMAFEKEFQRKVEYEDLIKIETVGDIISFIEKTRN